MIAPLNHACILSSSHLLHFHRPRPVVLLHHEKNRVADWCDLNDLFYSELSELCAHNRKVNMNQFSLRFPNKVQGVNTADVLMIKCVCICSYAFSILPKGYGPSIECALVVIRLAFPFPHTFLKVCTRAHRFHWSLLLFVSLCYRCKIKYTLQGLKQ